MVPALVTPPQTPAPEKTRATRLAAGCAAGMALAAAGTWLRFGLEHTPRIDTHTGPFVLASAVSGAGLILTGICSLRLAPLAAGLSWRALWGGALAVQAAALAALPLTSSDVFTNLSFGALALAGMSPYTHAPPDLGSSPLVALVPPRWVNDPSPYGPLFHPFAHAAAWVGSVAGSPFWASYYAFKVILCAAVLAALALAVRHLRATRPAEAAETFALLALGPLVAWEIPAQGHNDGLLFLALVAFLVAAAAERQLLAVVALAAGVAVKYALAPLLGLYLLLAARRSIARAALLALAAALVIGAAFAPELHTVTLRAVLPMVGGEAARHAHSFTDLVCLILGGLGLPAASLTAYKALSAASALLCAALLLRAALRSQTFEQLAHGYLLFLLALYLTAPWFQPWYLSWGLPFLLVEPDPRWRRFFALFAVLTVAQWAAPLDPVTTVACDAWAAWRIWRLARPAGDRPLLPAPLGGPAAS
jgi:alpha-1,6-mannosyltransferase